MIDPNTHVPKWAYDSELTVNTRYTIIREHFNFFANGTFQRLTQENQTALDEKATDWCNGVPATTAYRNIVYYYGTHDYSPGDDRISYVTTRGVCADPLGICGYGSRGGALTISCHSMMITAGSEGQREIRMYSKVNGVFSVIDSLGTVVWHK